MFRRRGSEGGVALQAERAHRTLQIGCRDGGSADGPHPLEHRGHRRARWSRPVLSDRWNRLRQNRSQQFGWRYAAAHLRCRVGPGRRADHQIGGLGHIDASFGQSCDDTDRPCMSGGPTTTENQSNVFNHLPTIAARGHSCPSRYQDRASRPVFRSSSRPAGTIFGVFRIRNTPGMVFGAKVRDFHSWRGARPGLIPGSQALLLSQLNPHRTRSRQKPRNSGFVGAKCWSIRSKLQQGQACTSRTAAGVHDLPQPLSVL